MHFPYGIRYLGGGRGCTECSDEGVGVAAGGDLFEGAGSGEEAFVVGCNVATAARDVHGIGRVKGTGKAVDGGVKLFYAAHVVFHVACFTLPENVAAVEVGKTANVGREHLRAFEVEVPLVGKLEECPGVATTKKGFALDNHGVNGAHRVEEIAGIVLTVRMRPDDGKAESEGSAGQRHVVAVMVGIEFGHGHCTVIKVFVLGVVPPAKHPQGCAVEGFFDHKGVGNGASRKGCDLLGGIEAAYEGCKDGGIRPLSEAIADEGMAACHGDGHAGGEVLLDHVTVHVAVCVGGTLLVFLEKRGVESGEATDNFVCEFVGP